MAMYLEQPLSLVLLPLQPDAETTRDEFDLTENLPWRLRFKQVQSPCKGGWRHRRHSSTLSAMVPTRSSLAGRRSKMMLQPSLSRIVDLVVAPTQMDSLDSVAASCVDLANCNSVLEDDGIDSDVDGSDKPLEMEQPWIQDLRVVTLCW